MVFSSAEIINTAKRIRQALTMNYFRLVLLLKRKPPVIISFTHDSYIGIEGTCLLLKWKVKNTYKVSITHAGSFVQERKCLVKIDADVNCYHLTAYGFGGTVNQTIFIKPLKSDRAFFREAQISEQKIPAAISAYKPAPETRNLQPATKQIQINPVRLRHKNITININHSFTTQSL